MFMRTFMKGEARLPENTKENIEVLYLGRK
jgi:hypothetical protein